jgi:hypothetical protein
MRKNVWVLGSAMLLLAACSSDGGSAGGTSSTAAGGTGGDALRQCVIGNWTSTSMDAPGQAALDVTPEGGGDGMEIQFGADGLFQIDFGPMNPTTASFTKAGEAGTLSTRYSGVGEGSWEADAQGGVTGVFADLTTVTATVEITLGSTVPPVFDETLQQLNDNRMLNGETTGTYTVTACQGDTLTMTTPFPSGTVTVQAARKA